MILNSILCATAVAFPAAPAIQSWKVYDIPELRISIESPKPPQKFDYDVKASGATVKRNSWKVINIDTSYILLSFTEFMPGDQPSARDAANGSIDTIRANMPNQLTKPSLKDVTVSGLKGVKTHWVYDFKGDKTVYISTVVTKKNQMWQMIANYPSDSATSKWVDRMFASWKIKP